MRRAGRQKRRQESNLYQRPQHNASDALMPGRRIQLISCCQTLSITRSTQTSNISRRAVNSEIEPSVSSQPMNVSNSARAVLIPTIQSSVHSLLKVIVLNSSK